jgi:hypothetical protein
MIRAKITGVISLFTPYPLKGEIRFSPSPKGNFAFPSFKGERIEIPL